MHVTVESYDLKLLPVGVLEEQSKMQVVEEEALWFRGLDVNLFFFFFLRENVFLTQVTGCEENGGV